MPLQIIDVQLAFDIANFLFLIGTTDQIRAVLKGKHGLSGYGIIGTLFTLIPMIIIDINYIQMEMWFSLITALFTTTYWLLATFYSWKAKIWSWWEQRKGRKSVEKLLGISIKDIKRKRA